MRGEEVEAFHAAHAGITEDLLAPARSGDLDPFSWLMEPVGPGARVLDLACGSAVIADHAGSYLGVDASAAELAEARRRRPGVDVRLGDALDPQWCASSYDAVVVSMALMLLDAERLLGLALTAAPLVVAMVPRRGDAVRGTAYGEVLAALDVLDQPFPTDVDALPGAQVSDRVFLRPPDPDLVLASFYARAATDAQRSTARDLLTAPLPYPLRRLVWHR